ncbi:hypothetical protein OHA84_02600 [Streptomyces sp. NBC_00513]|uniref:hypothetical protein n=1 Tax=unclassified Streptomyces TaxID=2593676 RepID=UPI00225520ED|nr:hypothetical protein [Streptomyces sp. NBC_00424]MCX5077565.1 hypothetical protein [Streptomyces sp. NBC_00424]WUD39461.1 hypothetical protein OHA84_02600 [Streptomyces sp. NBC_00513]
MTHSEATPQTPEPVPEPAPVPVRQEPSAPREANRYGNGDSVVLIALLATCAGIYLAVGDTGFAGVISAVAALYGTWRTRR